MDVGAGGILQNFANAGQVNDHVKTEGVGLPRKGSRDRQAGKIPARGLQKDFRDWAWTPSDLDPHDHTRRGHQADHASLHLRIRGDRVRMEGNRPARVLATSAVKRVIGKMLVSIPLRSRDVADVVFEDPS